MTFLPSLPDPAHLSDLFRAYPGSIDHLMQFTDGLLRGDGALSIGERELIATYVSGLNACKFCFESHLIYAKLFGIEADVVESLLEDIDSAKIDEAIKPILRYVKKLNTLPCKLVNDDAKAVYDAGWGEEALFEAVKVCGLFNMMNRIIEGTGVNFDYKANPQSHPASNSSINEHQHSYVRFGEKLSAVQAGES